MRKQRPFVVDADCCELLIDEVGTAQIVELSVGDASLVAPFIDGSPDTVYAAASGVALSPQHGVFKSGGRQLAIEWVREEPSPSQNEPECNAYRYLFGETPDGRCVGVQVTRKHSGHGQVADHWTAFDDVTRRHFPVS